MSERERIAVIGLGYVGLPLALALARKFPNVLGFDVNAKKVEILKNGRDESGEVPSSVLKASTLTLTASAQDLREANFFIVAVPTPVDIHNKPDLTPLEKASALVGSVVGRGSVVVFESTVYPGVTEKICGPIIAKISGLIQGRDFKLGYSPERLLPGSTQFTLERIVKVVSGEDAETLERVSAVYRAIITAGIYQAPSIQVAEAAKVIENTQRDLNIALVNELAIIFDRLGIRSREVLKAAGTKWNFLPFLPGLVGGHCIGVDPYYLTSLAEQLGYHPQVILAGRRINDGMGVYIAQRVIKLLIHAHISVKGAKVAVLGLTFKEDVRDLRNSRIPDILNELKAFGVEPLVHDPVADAADAQNIYGIRLASYQEMEGLDGLIVAVAHQEYREDPTKLVRLVRPGGVLADVKSIFEESKIPSGVHYWSL